MTAISTVSAKKATTTVYGPPRACETRRRRSASGQAAAWHGFFGTIATTSSHRSPSAATSNGMGTRVGEELQKYTDLSGDDSSLGSTAFGAAEFASPPPADSGMPPTNCAQKLS